MNNLKAIREKAGKTQEDISSVLGIDKKTYRKYEKDGNIPSSHCVRLSEYYSELFSYGVSIDYLLGRVEHPFKDSTLRDFADTTHLSEDAISNIIYEGSENGDNRYVYMLDLLLSDKETFKALMDNMLSLVFPPNYYIDKKIWEHTGWMEVREDDSVIIDASFLDYVCDNMPDNIYQRMRHILDKFSKVHKNERVIAPNEYHPIGL